MKWLLERLAAALVGAVLVGVGAAVVMLAVDFLTAGSKVSVISYVESELYISVILAVVLGTVPGIVALTLMPPKKHPWKSLPALILATLAGFSIVFVFDVLTGRGIFETLIGTLALFLVPTVAVLLTAWKIERLPTPLLIKTERR